MLNYRLGTVNEKHWGSKPVSAAANLTLSQHFLEKKKKIKIVHFQVQFYILIACFK